MSDAAPLDEYYPPSTPALAPSPTPVAPPPVANDDTGPRFKGAMGGAAVGGEYPEHEPRLSVPYNRYKELETQDPKLFEAINHVAEIQRIPPTDLAALIYANSDNNPDARNGARVGYMGLTVNDSRQLDPEGQLDINKPVDNLFLGSEKYKQLTARYGEGTPAAFAAYYAGPERVDGVLHHNPDDHKSVAPAGTFEFINKVAGRGGQTPEQQLEENAANVDISQRDRVLKPQGSNIPAGDAVYRGGGPDVTPIPGGEPVPDSGQPRLLQVGDGDLTEPSTDKTSGKIVVQGGHLWNSAQGKRQRERLSLPASKTRNLTASATLYPSRRGIVRLGKSPRQGQPSVRCCRAFHQGRGW